MINKKTKEFILTAFDHKKNQTIQMLQTISNHPFSSETKLILFEVEGSFGEYGVRPIPMKDMATIAPSEVVSFSDMAIDYYAYEYVSEEYDQAMETWDDDEMDEFAEWTRDLFFDWFADRFQEVHHQTSIKLPCMLRFHDTSLSYDLRDKEWLTSQKVMEKYL